MGILCPFGNTVSLEMLGQFGNTLSVQKYYFGLEILSLFRDRKHNVSLEAVHTGRLEIRNTTSVSCCVILKYCVGLEIGNTISV